MTSMYEFIASEEGNYAIAVMCVVLGVSRSGFYAWKCHSSSPREMARARFERLILNILWNISLSKLSLREGLVLT